jgi:ABC-type transport system substrate-binding protein
MSNPLRQAWMGLQYLTRRQGHMAVCTATVHALAKTDPALDRLIDGMKSETDTAKRDAMIREALLRVREETLLIPLHHQIRPWVMKAGVTTVHRSDDRPEARFTNLR